MLPCRNVLHGQEVFWYHVERRARFVITFSIVDGYETQSSPARNDRNGRQLAKTDETRRADVPARVGENENMQMTRRALGARAWARRSMALVAFFFCGSFSFFRFLLLLLLVFFFSVAFNCRRATEVASGTPVGCGSGGGGD